MSATSSSSISSGISRALITQNLRAVAVRLQRYPSRADYQSYGQFPASAVLEATGATTWREALIRSGCHLGRVRKANKFGAQRAWSADGHVFTSTLEARHYEFLSLLQKAREISELRVQVPFPLVVNGIDICLYIADFTYYDNTGKFVIEDTKGKATPLAVTKMKLVEAVFGTPVTIIRASRGLRR
jgi:hypothetical protein